MGVFRTERILCADAELIPGIADAIAADFRNDQFTANVMNLVSGGADISLSKGGLFKAVLGLKSALKITLLPMSGGISFVAGVGIFGQQVIPSIISWFFYWPVAVTQIWGMIRQSALDDRALAVAERYIAAHSNAERTCSVCGKAIEPGALYCVYCGVRIGR